MYPTNHMFRIAQTIVVLIIGIMGALIVIGNTTDYPTNYHFIEHVMKMDTIFPDNNIQYRNINNPILYHTFYITIIIMETVMTFCCLKGGWLMLKHIKNDEPAFYAVKNWAVGGILIGLTIWFLIFQVVGAEWFAMWQSTVWNGLSNANRIVTFLGFALLLLRSKETSLAR